MSFFCLQYQIALDGTALDEDEDWTDISVLPDPELSIRQPFLIVFPFETSALMLSIIFGLTIGLPSAIEKTNVNVKFLCYPLKKK